MRTIVTSATYRQSSQGDARATARAIRRTGCWRAGPRFRLPAEMIRDQALAASGLLVERIGGPSVQPYQPPGLWKELTGGEDYRPDTGPSLYRRSLYTFWKRTVAPPSMMTFDAAGRETCTVREARTNTPLQALNLLNDVTFVEAAPRARRARPDGEQARIPKPGSSGRFGSSTARRPSPAERQILLEGRSRPPSALRSRSPRRRGN